MQRQRGELVPIGEAFGDLDGPVKALREATPQALHHFTQADQVNQLVTASEADPDLGFMARLMALCKGSAQNRANLYAKRFRVGTTISQPAGRLGNPPFPSRFIVSDRSSPSRVRFAASRPGRLRADPKDALLTRGKGGVGPWGARASG